MPNGDDGGNKVTDLLGLGHVGAEAVQVAGRFLDRIFGPAADEAGDAIAHPVREWNRRRKERGAQILNDAGQILEQAHLHVQPVPGRLLFPILQQGSVEEDDYLRRTWTRMLANAATANNQHPVEAAFPGILSALSPVEVRALDFIAEHGNQEGNDYVFENAVVGPAVGGLDMEQLHVIRDNLVRLNLLRQPMGIIPRLGAGEVDRGFYNGPLYLTALGVAFINACTIEQAPAVVEGHIVEDDVNP